MKTFFFVLVLMLSGCASHNITVYSPLDKQGKTVSVPPGAGGLKKDIKAALLSREWKLSIDDITSKYEGVVDKNISVKQSYDYKARYRLYIASITTDICLNGSAYTIYEISMVDNKTNTEAFTMDGRGCENTTIGQFVEILDGRKE